MLAARLQIVPADLAALTLAGDGQLRVMASTGPPATPMLMKPRIDLAARPAQRSAVERSAPTILHREPGEVIDAPDTDHGVVTSPGDRSGLEGLLALDVSLCRALQPAQVTAIGTLADLAARLIHEERGAGELSWELDRLANVRSGLREDVEAARFWPELRAPGSTGWNGAAGPRTCCGGLPGSSISLI